MKAIRLAAILLAFGGASAFVPQVAQAQVDQLGAELNIIPDKVTPVDGGIRISCVIMGIPGSAHQINGVDLNVGSKLVKATDIDGVDFERSFIIEDTSVVVVEIDFPFKGTLPKTATLTFHTTKGDITSPALQ